MSNQYATLEQELIAKTKFTPEKKYRRRQDLLAVYLRAVGDMSDEAWDDLSDDLATWSQEAAKVHGYNKKHNANNPLPDFPDATPSNGADYDATSDYDQGGEVQDHSELSDSENGEVSEEQTASTQNEGGVGEVEPTKAHKPKRVSKAKTKVARPKKEKGASRGVNQWGVVNGTKSDLVCRMLARPEGTTQKEISEATGQTHYNLCNRLQRYGHFIKKEGNRMWLIHKDHSEQNTAA